MNRGIENTKVRQIVFASLLLFAFSSCLKTRDDVAQTEQRQVVQQQQGAASVKLVPQDLNSRVSDLEEEMRNLNGRIELAENASKNVNQQSSNDKKAQEQLQKDIATKFNFFQEELVKMEAQLTQMQTELNGLKNSMVANSSDRNSTTATNSKLGTYDQAENLFKLKDWKKAILSYQKYRDENPKGKHFAEATYKIGVAFQELGMKDEARTFYDEVINKFPQTDMAKKSKYRLGQLKK